MVSAAAGSGKTAVLVERIIRLVTRDRVPLDSILVVTFTEAAASEMRQKIIAAMTGLLDENEDPFLRDQVQRIYKARISTFHSFALTILKKYFYLTDQDPAMRICDEFRADIIAGEALDRLFDEFFASGDEEFLDFLRKYATSKSERTVRDMITNLYKFIRTMPDPFRWLDESVERLECGAKEFLKSKMFRDILSEPKEELKAAINGLENLIDLLEESGVASLARKAEEDLAGILPIAEALEDDRFDDASAMLNGFKFTVFRCKKDEAEDYDAIRRLVDLRRSRVKDRIDALRKKFFARPAADAASDILDTAGAAGTLRRLVRRFHELFSGAKSAEGLIDFNDIEHLALSILENEQARGEYRDKFSHIFIDEYQDSNYIQEELIARISGKGNVFMVGDVKQSIYKFRLAEPEIFIRKYHAYSGGHGDSAPGSDNPRDTGAAIDLNRNFRSKAPIINEVNVLFRRIMDEGLSGIAYDERAELRLGQEYDRAWDRPVELIIAGGDQPEGRVDSGSAPGSSGLPGGDEEAFALKGAEREAVIAAEVITAAKGTLFYDTKLGRERPMEYRDMVVLLNEARNSGALWCETLMSCGIPAFTETGNGYLDALEIETFVNLLRVVDNAKQDVPLAATMYSSVFKFTTSELIHIRAGRKRGAFHEALGEFMAGDDSGALGEKCRKMFERIDSWRRDERFMELPDFLWKLMKESGYYDYAGALVGGEQRQANLRALVDKAAAFQRENIRGLFDFLRYLDTVNERKLSIGQVKLLSENDDVVRIMTIHKSKGLEYPLVIIGQMGRGIAKKADYGRLLFHKDIGLALQWEDSERHTWRRTLLQRRIMLKKSMEERAEVVRLLYVAMTRAMDRLVMIGTVNKGAEFLEDAGMMDAAADTDVMAASSWLSLFKPVINESGVKVSLAGPGDLKMMAEAKRSEASANAAGLRAMAEPGTDEGSAPDEISERLAWAYPYKDALKTKSKYSVTELAFPGNYPEKRQKPARYFLEGSYGADMEDAGILEESRSLTAAERGTALHKAFEKLDYREAYERRDDAGYFEEFLDGLEAQGLLTVAEGKAISARDIQRYARSPLCARVAASPCLRREAPFNLMRRMGGEDVMVQGVIDCFFEEEGKLVLVDFKSGGADGSDSAGKSKIAEVYSGQINLYRDALEKITGKRVDEAFIYMIRQGVCVEIPRN